LSSQIEGTQSSLSDLLLFENHEAPTVPLDGSRTSRGDRAWRHANARRLSAVAPADPRDACHPAQIRRRRDETIGRFSPIAKLDRRHKARQCSVRAATDRPHGRMLGRAGTVPPHRGSGATPAHPRGSRHVQFETIHPLLDGNGRLGRLLITLILCEAGVLREPILYLSLFLKSRRDDYYRLLQKFGRPAPGRPGWNSS
jgi:hypothetical protein